MLGQFLNRRTAPVKLLTASLFILLAGWPVVALEWVSEVVKCL